jgi:hypothetical protein
LRLEQPPRYDPDVGRLTLSLAALLVAAAVAVPAAAGGSSPRAKVRIVTMSPLAVRGTGFKPHERVRVTASPGGTRRVRARADGSFRVAFSMPADRCSGLSVSAVGARGDHASLKLPQMACPPQD